MISVGMPLYRSRDIAWLAMESLCAQSAPPEWELLVMEDVGHEFGREAIEAYKGRLNNCRRVVYLASPSWLPLSMKWQILAQIADPRSVWFALQAGDCYSYPGRLRNLANVDSGIFDWTQSIRYTFYDLHRDQGGTYDLFEWGSRTGDMMAVRTPLLRNASVNVRRRGVDHTLMEAIRPERVIQYDPRGWEKGVSISGQNSLSIGGHARTVTDDAFDLREHLPAPIADRLLNETAQINPLPSDGRQEPTTFIGPDGRVRFLGGVEETRLVVTDALGKRDVMDADDLAHFARMSPERARDVLDEIAAHEVNADAGPVGPSLMVPDPSRDYIGMPPPPPTM